MLWNEHGNASSISYSEKESLEGSDHKTYEACPKSKDTSRVGQQEIFYAYYGVIAVDLDPLPVSRARSTVVEPALFE